MKCVYCGEKTKTVNSRANAKGLRTWRRRQCTGCKAVFTTNEAPDMEISIRVKKDSVLEPFLYEKLFLDVHDSLTHRKTAYTDAGTLTSTIILNLLPVKSGVVSVKEIQEAVSKVLKRFDKAAATYYAAHNKGTRL